MDSISQKKKKQKLWIVLVWNLERFQTEKKKNHKNGKRKKEKKTW